MAWDAEFTLEPAGNGQLRLQGALKADGVPVSAPTLLVGSGAPAGIEVSTPDGRSLLALELRSAPLSSASAAVAAVATAATPAQAEATAPPRTDRMPPPHYPKEAFEQGIAGHVLLQIEVDAEGRARDVQVVESRPQGVFDAVSVAAARQWSFAPAREAGRAVPGKLRVPVRFALETAMGPTA